MAYPSKHMIDRQHLLDTVLLAASAIIVGWVVWFWLSPTMTMRWPHPVSPTGYFQWRQRPPVVQADHTKTLELQPGQAYTFVVRPPRSLTCLQFELNFGHLNTSGTIALADRSEMITAGRSAQANIVLADAGWFSQPLTLRWLGTDPIFLRSLSATRNQKLCSPHA